MDNFDDFGVDLCPIPEAALSDSDLEFDKNYCISNEKPKNALPSRVGCQMFEASDLSEAIPRGPNHNVTERNTSQTKVELNGEEPMKLEKMVANCLAVQNADFPSELKCSLCNTFFKEAVMIPCCQHSFCEKCIRAVLQEKAKCPKCYSSKCKVEDLLPNLSLRQAIEHFLESQILMSDADNALHKYAPVDFTINKKRGLWVNTGGGDRNFMATGRHKKGDRTCYMCGSPDHFIRDCPAASSPYPMLQTGNSMFPGAMSGYASPCWNSNPLPPIRPFTNMYGNSGMMPFNSGMVPSSPFAVPPYMPYMYGGLPVPSGFMRMGGMLAPQVQTGSERPLTHSENMQLRDCENRWKLSNENLGRRQSYDDEDDGYNKRYHCNVPERSRV